MYTYIGKIVNTHALKGELRIISNFEHKELIFKEGSFLFVGSTKLKLEIETYRTHKNYDMVKFKGYNDILEVECFKGESVYVLKEELGDVILDDDLIGMNGVFNNKSIGTVKEIINNNGYKIIETSLTMIPYNHNFIEKIDMNKKEIIFKNLEGLINEN